MADANSFNYNKIHLFDKDGCELMLSYRHTVTFKFINSEHENESAEYAFVAYGNKIINSTLYKIKPGTRYNKESTIVTAIVTINGNAVPERFQVNVGDDSFVPYESSDGTKYELNIDYDHWRTSVKKSFLQSLGIQISGENIVDDRIPFPSSTFESNLVFEKVSTELIETQSIYALVESNGKYVDVSTYVSEDPDSRYYSEAFIKKYGLFFFIDCREQSDFRIFTVSSDEITWTDRQFINFKNGLDPGPQNGYRVDIGFSGENEGVYEEKIYMCLAELEEGEYIDGAIHVIGKITMKAETEGFDERYKTLFTNFGLPDPIETEQVFSDSNDNDDKPDYRKINRHAKKTFLTYSEIFPYAGSYKALFNATKLLGYDDIFFKEWYREIGGEIKDNRGYVAYDITAGSTSKQNNITNKAIEERIHLKKLNWLSMMYRLEEEDNSKPIDIYGFPSVIKKENYYTRDKILKLMSLKKWLEKYIIGVNARITDVGGEGIVFERFSMPKYGAYQQVFDYTNELSVGASLKSKAFVIKDASATIQTEVNTSEEIGRIEDYRNKTFYYFSEGKFVKDGDDWTFKELDSSTNDSGEGEDEILYFGKCIELHDNLNTIEFKTKGTLESIRIGGDMVLANTSGIIVDDGEIFFDPDDTILYPNITIFNEPPIIEIKSGRIGEFNVSYDDSTNECVVTKNDEEIKRTRKVTLVPPTHNGTFNSYSGEIVQLCSIFDGTTRNIRNISNYCKDERTYGLVYNRDTKTNDAVFKIIGYECSEALEMGGTFGESQWTTRVLEIFDGHLLFNDEENNRKIILEFKSDSGKITVTPKVLQYFEDKTIYEYVISPEGGLQVRVERFTPNSVYNNFVENYKASPDLSILGNTSCSINVLNAGTYDIDAVILDQWNNMFSKRVGERINVVSPDIDASSYSTSEKSNNDFNVTGVERGNPFNVNDASTFVYKYSPKREISEIRGYDTNDVSIRLNFGEIHNNDTTKKYGKVMINATRAFVNSVAPTNRTIQFIFSLDRRYDNLEMFNEEFDAQLILVDNAFDSPVLIYDVNLKRVAGRDLKFETKNLSQNDYNEITSFLYRNGIGGRYDIYIMPSHPIACTLQNDGNVISFSDTQRYLIEHISDDFVYKLDIERYSKLSPVPHGLSSVRILEKDQIRNTVTIDTSIYKFNDDRDFLSLRPALETFFSTSLKIKESEDSPEEIIIDDDRSRELCYFLDPTFGVGFLDFDPRNGECLWADINERSLYTYNCPIRTSDPRIIIKPLLGRAFTSEPAKYTVRWKLFRQYANAKHELLLECWNRLVAFNLPEEGTYDVDLTVYDENGNKYNKFLDGIITYDKSVNE